MKYLVFRHTEDDRGNELLEEIEEVGDFSDEDEVLAWLATIDGSRVGTRYLIVAALSWVTAVIKEKPVTMYGEVYEWDDATLLRRQREDDVVTRAVKLCEGLPADAKAVPEKP